MATDNEQLVLSISADVRQIQRQLKGLVGQTQRDTKAIEDAFSGIDKAASGAFNGVAANSNRAFTTASQASRRFSAAMKESSAQTGNLAAQINDIGVQLAGGQSPFLIALQQGSQINQALGGSGLRATIGALGGAFTSLLNPVSLATLAIIGIGGSAVQYFLNLGNDAKDAEDVLKGHADLIRRIKDAYGEAAKGLEEYSTESKKILADDTAKSIKLYQEELQSAAKSLGGMLSEINPDDYRGSTYILDQLRGALNGLKESAADGEPDVKRFLERLIDIKNLQGTPDDIKELIDRILESGKASVDVQGKLHGLQNFINGVGQAAQMQVQQVDNFAKAIDRLANTALPQLSEMEQAVKDYNDAMRSAGGSEERAMARLAFEQAQERIRNQNPEVTNSDGRSTSVPIPNNRPLVELEGLGETTKKVKDSFAGLDGAVNRYVNQVVKAESGGNATARNPNSSAAGLGQFIESTWLDLFRKNFPDRAASMSRETILALRSDGEISRQLIEAYARGNAQILRQAGVSVNEAALHLAHFLGPQGAVSVLKAAPGTPVSQVLGQGAINANKSILGNGATVDDVVRYAESRAGQKIGEDYQAAAAGATAFTAAQRELNSQVSELSDVGRDVVGGFISDLRSGKSAAEAFGNALQKIADRLINAGLDGLFGGGSAGGPGLFGNLLGNFFGTSQSALAASGNIIGLFDEGGYTGAGGKHQPAGVVHKGEVIWSQDDVRRAGGVGVVEAMRRGMVGYDAGGPVAVQTRLSPSLTAGRKTPVVHVKSGDVIIQGDVRDAATVDEIDRRIQANNKRIAYAQQNQWRS